MCTPNFPKSQTTGYRFLQNACVISALGRHHGIILLEKAVLWLQLRWLSEHAGFMMVGKCHPTQRTLTIRRVRVIQKSAGRRDEENRIINCNGVFARVFSSLPSCRPGFCIERVWRGEFYVEKSTGRIFQWVRSSLCCDMITIDRLLIAFLTFEHKRSTYLIRKVWAKTNMTTPHFSLPLGGKRLMIRLNHDGKNWPIDGSLGLCNHPQYLSLNRSSSLQIWGQLFLFLLHFYTYILSFRWWNF